MEKKKKYGAIIWCFVLSAPLAFLFTLKSPLHPWNGSEAGPDSSVFKTVAMMMERGYMPYKDSFDHKGPFLYLLNWFGNKISPYRGIWVLEILFLMLTFVMLYCIARLFCKSASAILSAFLAASLLFGYYEGGNLTEEYAMAFLAVSLYIFLDYLKNERVTKLRLAICGFCFGATLLLRPNMISLWLVMCLAILIRSVVKQEWAELLGFILWFLVGMLVILLPILGWLAARGALVQCWKDYIVFNKEYSSAEGGRALFSAKWNAFFYFLQPTVTLMACCILAVLWKVRYCFLNVTFMIYLLVTLWMICMSGMTYGHYGMILVPALVYPFALAGAEIERIKQEGLRRLVLLLVTAYLLPVLILPNWLDLVKKAPDKFEARKENQLTDVTLFVADLVQEHVAEDEPISVYGNWNYIYILTNRRHATRYSFQFPIGQVRPEFMEEYLTQLKEEAPKILVVAKGYYDETIEHFLGANEYQLLYSASGSSAENPMEGPLVYLKKGN